jgi:hypothetical protein
MTTLAKATGGTSGHPSTRRKPYYVENTIDFSVDDPAANDIVQFLNIPAETCVMAAGLEVLTASSSGVTLDLGWTATSGNLATDIDRFVDGHDSTSAGIAAVAAATAGWVTYKAADTIDVKVLGAQDTAGKVRVWAVMCDISGSDESASNS